MATIETERQHYYQRLKDKGLNPFDLLSWHALINLELETRSAGHSRDFSNGKIHQLTRRMIWGALERRAEYRDATEGGDRWETHIQELQAES